MSHNARASAWPPGMDPDDGYRVIVTDVPGETIALHVGVYMGGVLHDFGDNRGELAAVPVCERRQPDDRAFGAVRRLQGLVEAYCRYFNLGGSWAELDTGGVLAALRLAIPGGLDFPGFFFFESIYNLDGRWEHTFVDAARPDEAVLWVEESFIERTTLDQIAAGRQGDDDDDDAADFGVVGGAEAGELADHAHSQTQDAPGGPPRRRLS